MEVLIVLLAVVLMVMVLLVIVLLRQGRGADPALLSALADLRNLSEKINQLADIRTQQALAEATQRDLKERLERAHQSLEALQVEARLRHQREEETLAVARRIESVFYGSFAKGRAGENVLAEALAHLPPEMVSYNFIVNGKTVEFGLVLANGKTLPIDSKWPAADLLSRLEEEDDAAERARLIRELEREVERRIREVAQYIDPVLTADMAVAALPDAVYSLCRSAFAEAYRRRVFVTPYSMALPYLLALYQLHMQYAQTIDLQNLKARLGDIGRSLGEMEQILESRLARAHTMMGNATVELRQLLGRLRGSLVYLQQGEAPIEAEPLLPALNSPDPPEED